MRSDVPEGWELKTVSQLFKLGRGRVINKQYLEENAGPYPVYSSQTKENGVFGYIDSYDFEGDHVTWTTDGANAGTVFFRSGRFNCTNVCGTLRPVSDDVCAPFFAYLLGTKTKPYVSRVGNDKLMNNIVAEIPTLLPPLAEQRKIAAILTSVDEAIQATEAVIAQTRRVKEGLLQELLTKGIGHTRFKQTEIGEIPEGWEVAQNGQMAEVTSSKRVFQSDYAEKGVPFYRSKEIIMKAKGLHLTESHFISENCFESLTKKHGAPKAGDILISAVGSIGFVYLVEPNERFYFKDGNLLWLRNYKRKVEPKFLRYYYTSRFFQDQLDRVTGGSSQAALTIEKLNKLSVPLPPIEEQRTITTHVNAQDEAISSQRESLLALKSLKSGLLQDLLTGRVRV